MYTLYFAEANPQNQLLFGHKYILSETQIKIIIAHIYKKINTQTKHIAERARKMHFDELFLMKSIVIGKKCDIILCCNI